MPRAFRSVAAIVLSALLLAGASARAQEVSGKRSEGRRLDEALADLQRRGLKIIYSSEVVKPDMRVRAEPRVRSPRRILDELLAEHGLIARDGPGGNLLVVKNPRARLANSPISQKNQMPSPAAAGDSAEQPRFAETIRVTDVEFRGPAGPPPLAVAPFEVRAVAGGFENIFRTLQALPGVTGTDELGSRIAVRGGSPDQNLTVMDGIEIQNPYRHIPVEVLSHRSPDGRPTASSEPNGLRTE